MFRLNTKKKIAMLTAISWVGAIVIYLNASKLMVNSTSRPLKRNISIFFQTNLKIDGHIKTTSSSSMGKTKILLFVGIHSAPSRLERRNAIRETWMIECRNTSRIACRFFTDGRDPKGQDLGGNDKVALEKEAAAYNDILLTEVPGGVNFAVKYLWMLQWASKRYDFQYFLRLDDDYFLCFHKLVLELESHRPKEKFQWGWLHCDLPVATWLDEAFYLASKDIVGSFLSRKDTLLCHVWESQAIGYWIKSISNITTFADNKRLLHTRSGFNSEKDISFRTEICHSFLGIHQSYPEKMRAFWRVYEKENKNITYYAPPVTYDCKYPLAMDYKTWNGNSLWFSEPKPCKDNPTWDRNGEYKGRRGY